LLHPFHGIISNKVSATSTPFAAQSKRIVSKIPANSLAQRKYSRKSAEKERQMRDACTSSKNVLFLSQSRQGCSHENKDVLTSFCDEQLKENVKK